VTRDLLLPTLVVDAPLLAPTDTADGLSSVEERNRFIVLTLAVLDDQPAPGVVSIYWQPSTPTVPTGVPDEPRESVLTDLPRS
jgi:hypothetical protein